MAKQSVEKSRRVGFLVFPQVVLLDLTGAWDVFHTANVLSGRQCPPYALELISGDDADAVLSFSGILMAAQQKVSSIDGSLDTLVVPAVASMPLPHPSQKWLAGIGHLAQRSRRVVSICGGAMLLAAAGLLEGKRATTHWRVADDLAASFPNVSVEPDAIFVKDGNTYSSAGGTAGIDLALALVEEDLGRGIALEIARMLVVFMRRPGGQSQFSATLQAQYTERNSINDLIVWATDNPACALSVSAMAERANMSVRNFSRVFRREVGETPAFFVEKLRVNAARRQLDATDDALDSIASQCGFGSADSMRRSFRRVLNVAPNDYRRRFSQT